MPGEQAQITFSCSSCEQKLSASLSYAGRSVKCPHCGTTVTIPGGAARRPVSHAKAQATHKRQPTRHTSPSAGRPSKAPMVVLLSFVALAAVCGVIGIISAVKDARAPKPPRRSVQPTSVTRTAGRSPTTTTTVRQRERPQVPRVHKLSEEERLRLSEKWGKGLEDKRERERAEVAEWQEKADTGDADSLFHLGEAYEFGRGDIEVDAEKAAEFYAQAAAKDQPDALFRLAEKELHKEMPSQSAVLKHLHRAGLAYHAKGDRDGGQKVVSMMALIGAKQLAEQLWAKFTGEERLPGSGTGWFCRGGYIVTCYHVVANRKKLYIQSDGIERTSVTMVGQDAINDVAVLKVEDASAVRPGIPLATEPAILAQRVFTLGFPLLGTLGNSLKFNEGSVSSLKGLGDDPTNLQVSVPLQPGNSGGPLMNTKGEVLGITASVMKTAQNVNYAVKVDHVHAVLEKIEMPEETKVHPAEEGTLAEITQRVRGSVVTVIAR